MNLVDGSFYDISVDSLASRVRGVFVLDGAYCQIRSDTVSSNPPEILSGGFNYDNDENYVVKAIFPNAPTHIHFIFYERLEEAIHQDVHCDLYWDEVDEFWRLIISAETPVLAVLPHKEVYMSLTQLQESITVKQLRDIISGVRQYFYMAERDYSFDILYEKVSVDALDLIISNILKYLKYVKDADYRFDLFLDSVPITVNSDNQALKITISKNDNARVEAAVVSVTMMPNMYGSIAQLKIDFNNDNDPFIGMFNYIPKDVTPFNLKINLDLADTNYIINGILGAIPSLQYNYVK